MYVVVVYHTVYKAMSKSMRATVKEDLAEFSGRRQKRKEKSPGPGSPEGPSRDHGPGSEPGRVQDGLFLRRLRLSNKVDHGQDQNDGEHASSRHGRSGELTGYRAGHGKTGQDQGHDQHQDGRQGRLDGVNDGSGSFSQTRSPLKNPSTRALFLGSAEAGRMIQPRQAIDPGPDLNDRVPGGQHMPAFPTVDVLTVFVTQRPDI